jgi:hypothetical protein
MSLVRLTALVGTVGLLCTLGSAPAKADATQLCRSITTMLLAPTDALAAPYIAGRDEYVRMEENDDTTGVKIAYTVPGYVFLTGVQVYGAAIRLVAGALEFVPGLITLFREGSTMPYFYDQHYGEALYSAEWGPCPIRVGTSYTAS